MVGFLIAGHIWYTLQGAMPALIQLFLKKKSTGYQALHLKVTHIELTSKPLS